MSAFYRLRTGAAAPRNKGCLIGPKLSLKAGQVWSVRFHLKREGQVRDFALLALANPSMMTGTWVETSFLCDEQFRSASERKLPSFGR